MRRVVLLLAVLAMGMTSWPKSAGAATYEAGFLRGMQPSGTSGSWLSNPYPNVVDGNDSTAASGTKKTGGRGSVGVGWTLPEPITLTRVLLIGSYSTAGDGMYWVLTVWNDSGKRFTVATTIPGEGGMVTLESPIARVVRASATGYVYYGKTVSLKEVELYGYVPDSVPPAEPQGLQVAPDMGQLTLFWDLNTEADLAGYRVRWAQEGAPFSSADVGKATSYTISNLTNGTEYVVQVIAYDIDGNESPPAEATGVPQLPPPTNLAATSPGDGTVQLHWEPSLSEGATYRIYRDGQHLSDTEETSYHDAAVAVGETYSYVVVTVDANGAESSPAGPVQVTVTDTTPPPTPQNLQVQLTGNTATISWIPVVASDLAGYQVYRNSQLLARTTETTYEDRGLAGGSEYTYQVTAYDQYGNEGVPAKATLGTPGTPLSKAGYSLSDFARYLADSLALYGPAWLVAAGLVLAGALLDRALLYWRRGHL